MTFLETPREFMRLLDIRLNSAFLVPTLTVLAAVGICVTTLIIVRPWPENRTAGAVVSSRDVLVMPAPAASPTPEAAAPTVTAKTDPIAEQTPEPPAETAIEAETEAEDETAEVAQEVRAEPLSANATAAAVETSPQAAQEAEQTEQKLAALPAPVDAPEPAHTAAMPKGSARLTKAEVEQALKPLLSYDLSDNDIKTLKEVIRLVQRDEFSAARGMSAKLNDTGARKLADWYYFRAGALDASAEEIADFRASNAMWPNRDVLDERVEEALFWREPDPKKVLDFFSERRPVSGAGKAALASALLTTGKIEEGKTLLRESWRQHYLTPAIETRLKNSFGDHLRGEDHKARLDWLLVKDRKSDIKAIERMSSLVDKKWEKSIQAQVAAIRGEKNSGALLSRLDAELKNDPAVLLARIKLARRGDDEEAVWALLKSAPTDPRKLINTSSWWEHRESQIRYALNAGQPKTAYALAHGHGGGLPPEELSDAEFLSGWIALRFLNDTKTAHKHLVAAAAAGGMPKHRARANYWLGRTELALGNKRGATARFAEAAQHSHTFYGQLARQAAEFKALPYAMRPYARPSASDIRSFTRNDVLRALAAANKAGLDNLAASFIDDLARTITSAPDMTLLCELAARWTEPHRAVRMAKIAMNRGFPVEYYAYPEALPEFQMLAKRKDLEEALIHALTRQESEFNPTIVSPAGAVGLMQLLPSTAKEVARANDVKFEKAKLSSDPRYNLSLGSAFLHSLITNYNGSYIMALAAYNAGPGRVRQWVGQFGDPRDKKVDPIDWIERIPFKETREYVYKIMESAQVYRARLDRNSHALQLAQDLHRGRTDTVRTFLEAGLN